MAVSLQSDQGLNRSREPAGSAPWRRQAQRARLGARIWAPDAVCGADRPPARDRWLGARFSPRLSPPGPPVAGGACPSRPRTMGLSNAGQWGRPGRTPFHSFPAPRAPPAARPARRSAGARDQRGAAQPAPPRRHPRMALLNSGLVSQKSGSGPQSPTSFQPKVGGGGCCRQGWRPGPLAPRRGDARGETHVSGPPVGEERGCEHRPWKRQSAGLCPATTPGWGPARLTSLLAPRRDPERRGQERDPRAVRAHLAAAAARAGDRKPGPRARGPGAEREAAASRGAPALRHTPADLRHARPLPPRPAAETPPPGRPGLRPRSAAPRPAVCTVPRLRAAWGCPAAAAGSELGGRAEKAARKRGELLGLARRGAFREHFCPVDPALRWLCSHQPPATPPRAPGPSRWARAAAPTSPHLPPPPPGGCPGAGGQPPRWELDQSLADQKANRA